MVTDISRRRVLDLGVCAAATAMIPAAEAASGLPAGPQPGDVLVAVGDSAHTPLTPGAVRRGAAPMLTWPMDRPRAKCREVQPSAAAAPGGRPGRSAWRRVSRLFSRLHPCGLHRLGLAGGRSRAALSMPWLGIRSGAGGSGRRRSGATAVAELAARGRGWPGRRGGGFLCATRRPYGPHRLSRHPAAAVRGLETPGAKFDVGMIVVTEW
jgi:hypothetical protein